MVAKEMSGLVLAIAAVAAAGCSCGIDAGKLGSIECETENDCLDGEVCEGGYCQYEGAGGDGDADGDGDGDADGDADGCPGREVRCGGDCVDLSSSDDHCGRCDRSCDPDEPCVDGQCDGARCDPGLVYCEADGRCVDVSTDADNCGRCGNACEGGATCDAGNCGGCEADLEACPDAGCVDLSTDRDHCGDCDNVCRGGSTCEDGECACPAGQTDCDAGLAADCRVTDASDPSNCGGCGVTCQADEYCDGGACACRPGLTDECGGDCTSLATDPANCGACDSPCEDFCQSGHCVAECPDGARVCDGYCTNTRSDPLNCGDCGDACAVDRVCIDGECRRFEVPLACDACPCDGCSEDFDRCCTYPGAAIPVCVDAESCG